MSREEQVRRKLEGIPSQGAWLTRRRGMEKEIRERQREAERRLREASQQAMKGKPGDRLLEELYVAALRMQLWKVVEIRKRKPGGDPNPTWSAALSYDQWEVVGERCGISRRRIRFSSEEVVRAGRMGVKVCGPTWDVGDGLGRRAPKVPPLSRADKDLLDRVLWRRLTLQGWLGDGGRLLYVLQEWSAGNRSEICIEVETGKMLELEGHVRTREVVRWTSTGTKAWIRIAEGAYRLRNGELGLAAGGGSRLLRTEAKVVAKEESARTARALGAVLQGPHMPWLMRLTAKRRTFGALKSLQDREVYWLEKTFGDDVNGLRRAMELEEQAREHGTVGLPTRAQDLLGTMDPGMHAKERAAQAKSDRVETIRLMRDKPRVQRWKAEHRKNWLWKARKWEAVLPAGHRLGVLRRRLLGREQGVWSAALAGAGAEHWAQCFEQDPQRLEEWVEGLTLAWTEGQLEELTGVHGQALREAMGGSRMRSGAKADSGGPGRCWADTMVMIGQDVLKHRLYGDRAWGAAVEWCGLYGETERDRNTPVGYLSGVMTGVALEQPGGLSWGAIEPAGEHAHYDGRMDIHNAVTRSMPTGPWDLVPYVWPEAWGKVAGSDPPPGTPLDTPAKLRKEGWTMAHCAAAYVEPAEWVVFLHLGEAAPGGDDARAEGGPGRGPVPLEGGRAPEPREPAPGRGGGGAGADLDETAGCGAAPGAG